MKLLHTCLAVLLMVLCTGPVAVAQTTTMDYSYYDGTTDLAQTGSGKKETYDVAIHINQPALTGTTIKGVIISIPHTTAVSNLKVWLSKKLTLQSIDGKKQNVPDICTQPADTALAFSSTYIPLDQPYTITEGGVYVGYTFTINAVGTDQNAANPLIVCESQNEGGFMIHSTKKYLKWVDQSDVANLAMTVRIDGVAANSASVSLPATIYTITGQAATTNVTVANYGANGVQSFDIDYTVNGTPLTQHCDLPAGQQLPGEFGKSTQVAVSLPAIGADGTYPATISISKVNGQPNSSTAAPTVFEVDARAFIPTHRPVVEEFTGTWCGNCPRGYVAMKAMKRLHPDRFVGLAYHFNDSMMVMTQEQFPLSVTGYPIASIERHGTTDPYFGSDSKGAHPLYIEREWLAYANQYVPVDVAVEAKLSADGKEVTAQAGITSTRAMSNAGYKVEFVLVGNGLSGTGNGWVQENDYNNATADIFPEPEFAPFLGTADKVAGLDYDDVVLATTRTLGTDVALPNALEAYKPCQAAATFELDAIVTPDKLNPVKFNKTKLDVVALLINVATNKVVNAGIAAVDATDYRTAVGQLTTTGVQPKQPTIYYDLSGRCAGAAAKGVLITNTGRKVVR